MPRLRAPVILLPPSEAKAVGGGSPGWETAPQAFPSLGPDRALVRDAVRVAVGRGEAVAGRLLGVGGRHLEQALVDWDALDEAPTMAAAGRYRGVVWTALDPATLERSARRRLDQRVLVPSGLWGLARATDPIPAYRLKMGARVAPLGLLAAFWRPRITPLIAELAAGGWIIDLLPDEHAAALDPHGLGSARLLRVELVDGERRAMGHAGKHLKGRLARAILESDARTPREVAALAVPGLAVARDVARSPRGTTTVSFVTT